MAHVRVALLGATGHASWTAAIAAALADERDQARRDAASARTLAILGRVVGVLGLVAGGVALARGSKPAAEAAPARDSESVAGRPR